MESDFRYVVNVRDDGDFMDRACRHMSQVLTIVETSRGKFALVNTNKEMSKREWYALRLVFTSHFISGDAAPSTGLSNNHLPEWTGNAYIIDI